MKVPATVLFDADGVIQRWSPALRPTLAGMIPHADKVDDFILELSRAEAPCLAGTTDLQSAFTPVLARWHSDTPVQKLIAALTLIEPDREILALVANLRDRGIACHLATNQQRYRARYMSRELGYAALFDREFYSCDLGLVKPEPAYFTAVIDTLGISPAEALFIDDREANVASARDLGIAAAVFHISTGASRLAEIVADFGPTRIRHN